MARSPRFEWDPLPDFLDRRRHGSSSAEVVSVFVDHHSLLIDDHDHFHGADRFALLGLSSSLRVLFICHCDRAKGGVGRLISAGKASRKEQIKCVVRLES